MGEATINRTIQLTSAEDRQVHKAVTDAVNIKFSLDVWLPLIISFTLGSFTSALWVWREERQARINEIVSSALVSGMIAAAFIAFLSDHGLTFGMLVFTSI